MNEKFIFLPHLRTRIAALAQAGSGPRLNLSCTIQVTGDGQKYGDPVSITAPLRGPGDIIAIHSSSVARVEPTPGLRGFEPNYFPFIEFVDADTPWRYTLETGDSNRKMPWIALLALKDTEFEFIKQGTAPLPGIRIKNDDSNRSLPDLSQAWAWAHAQVRLPDGERDTPEAVLEEDPTNGFSRLLCCRRLEPLTSYHLFLVPTYQSGALAGLDRKVRDGVFNGIPEAWDAPAWEPDAQDAEIPYYYHSRFITDAREDIEELIKRLRTLTPEEKSDAGISKRASAANPGYYEGYTRPGRSFQIQNVLQHTSQRTEDLDTDAALITRMEATLTETIKGENGESSDGNDPLVSFPPYGFRYGPEESVDKNAQNRKWFHRINLDLKMRHAASLGSKMVAENQEEMARICQEQYEEIAQANQRIFRLQTSEQVGKRLIARHFDKLAPDIAVALSEPLQSFVLDKSGKEVITDSIRKGGTPTRYASRGMRRLSAKRPIPKTAAAGAPGSGGIPMPAIPGDITSGPLSRSAAEIPGSVRMGFLTDTGLNNTLKNLLAPLLGPSAFEGFKRPQSKISPVRAFRSHDHATNISQTLKILPLSKADFTVHGRNEKESSILAPLYRSPVVPLPLSKFLIRSTKEAMLPGLSGLPLNTVSLFRENRHFIEAFMVGANHAMNEELRWREFPTDMRGTIFRRFWDRGMPMEDPKGDDITEIHRWTGKLGENPGPSGADHSENLVFLIRGDIIRKLDLPILTLNITRTATWKIDEIVETREPAFLGKIDTDTAYYGFDISQEWLQQRLDRACFHIYEPAGRLRFGLDVASMETRMERDDYMAKAIPFPMAAAGKSYRDFRAREALEPKRRTAPSLQQRGITWDDLSWSHMTMGAGGYIDFDHPFSLSGETLQYWDRERTSATLARSFWQKPVAAVIPVKRLIDG